MLLFGADRRLLRRYPQFCTFMGLSSETIKGLSPKYHPPGWTLRLCEEVLDDCWKAEEDTGAQAGAEVATAGNWGAQRAAVGESIVLFAQAIAWFV